MKQNKLIFTFIAVVFATLSSFSQDFETKLRTTNNLVNDGNYEEALQVYNQLLDSGEGDSIQQAWVNGYAGICLENLNKTDDAINYYKNAINLGFPSYSIYDKLNAIAKSKKDYTLQKFTLESKLKMFPELETATLKSLCYVYANLRDYETLLKASTQMLEFTPESYKMHYFKGLAFQQLKDNENAINSYKSALVYNADDYGSNSNLGLLLYNQLSVKYEKENSKYNALAKPTRVEYSDYTKATEALKKEYLNVEPYLLKAYQKKQSSALNKALYNLYTRTLQKEKIVSLNLKKE